MTSAAVGLLVAFAIAIAVPPVGLRAQEPLGGKGVPKLKWTMGPPTSGSHAYHAAVFTAGKFYVLPGGSESKFEVFDPAKDAWGDLPSPKTARDFAGAATIGKQIFFGGGTDAADSRKNVATVDVYDVDKGLWSPIAPLTVPRSRLVFVAADDKLFAIGGFVGRSNDESDEGCVEVYDPVQNKWSLKRPMPTARHGHFAVAVHGRIWVLGGFGKRRKPTDGRDYGPLDSVEVYDPKTDEWTAKPSMPTPSGFSGAACLSDVNGIESLLVIGGHYDVQHVVRFDFTHERWDACNPAPVQLTRFAMVSSPAVALISGGEHSPRETWWLRLAE